jgi:hypothetical protein
MVDKDARTIIAGQTAGACAIKRQIPWFVSSFTWAVGKPALT